MNEERMRELYARHTALRAASDPPCQVSLDEMIAVLEHQGSDDHRREIMAQILRSPTCREEFELLRALVRASQEVAVPAGVDAIPSPRRSLLSPSQWRIAAGILMVIGAGAIGWMLRSRPADQLRGGSSTVALYQPREEERVGSLPGFVWGRVPGAIEYRFQLLGESGQVVYSVSGTDTAAAVPASVVIPAGRYLWNVTVVRSGGVSVSSPTRGVVVSP